MPSSASACAPSASCSVSCLGHLERELLVEPLLDVQPGQLGELLLGLVAQLAALLVEQRELGVLLGAHRDVLTGRHAQRAGRQTGHAGDQDRAAVAGRTRHAHHDAGGRDDAVVGAEHTGAQPVEPVVEPALVRLVLVRARPRGRHVELVGSVMAHRLRPSRRAASKVRLGCAHASAACSTRLGHQQADQTSDHRDHRGPDEGRVDGRLEDRRRQVLEVGAGVADRSVTPRVDQRAEDRRRRSRCPPSGRTSWRRS